MTNELIRESLLINNSEKLGMLSGTRLGVENLNESGFEIGFNEFK